MATQILAVGETEAASATQTLADGETAVYFLTTSLGHLRSGACVEVQFETADGGWMTHAVMQEGETSAIRLDGPIGGFRFLRRLNLAVGVDQA